MTPSLMQLRKHPALHQWLVVGGFLLLIGAALALMLYQDHAGLEAVERDRLATQASVINQNLERRLEAIYKTLEAIRRNRELWVGEAGRHAASRQLQTLGDAMLGVRTLTILDAGGRVIASNRENLIGQDFSERAYFRTARAGGDPAMLYVSPPFTTALGAFAINMVRVMLDANGKFVGIVAATLDPAYFGTLLSSVRYAPDMVAGLAHGDGRQLMLVPEREGMTGLDLARAGSMFMRHMESGQPASVLVGPVLATGDTRLMAQRTVRPASVPMDKALVVATGRDLSAVYADWRRDVYLQSGLFTLLTLSSIVGLSLYQRRQRAYGRLVADRDAERRQVDAGRREHERMLADSQAIAHIGSWAVEVASGKITWSEESFRLYGLPPAADQAPAFGEPFLALLHPDDRQRMLDWAAGCLSGKAMPSLEYRTRPVNGVSRWLLGIGLLEAGPDGKPSRMTGTVQDISEHKAAELIALEHTEQLARAGAALAQSEAQLRLFIQHAPSALAMFDREMRYVVVSRRWLCDYGLEGQALTGRSHYEVFPEIPPHWKDAHRRALAGQGSSADAERFDRADGTVLWLRWEVLPWYDKDGTVGGVVIFTEDISELQAARDRLASFAAEQIRGIEAERKRLAREVHDQIGQVFTAVKLIVNSLPREAFPPDQETALTQALDMGIATTRKITAELRPPLLDDLGFAPAIEHFCVETTRASGLSHEVDIDAQTALDATQALTLFRIAQEALTNVLRHADARHVTITGHRDGGRYVFCIEDDGHGFPPGQLRPGAMGLKNMRERTMLLGGSCEIGPGPRGGTRVTAILPLGDNATDEYPAA
jgi:PAS domain S-box-containing protein